MQTAEKELFQVGVQSSRSVAPGIHELVLERHSAIDQAQPGQFVHVAASRGIDPLLRRPMSISSVGADGEWSLLFRVKGTGTQALSSLTAGELVDVLGPLGRGFTWPEATTQPLLVAGGLGVAPLRFLAQRLCESGFRPRILLGFATAQEAVCSDDFQTLGLVAEVATDDGSLGHRGFVTDLLPTASDSLQVYACGPLSMLRAVVTFCQQRQVPCEVSLEERMACGVGACLGCVCPIRPSGSKDWVWQRVCEEGPVFDGTEVAFDVMC